MSSHFFNPERPLEYLFQNINHPYLNFGMFMTHGLVRCALSKWTSDLYHYGTQFTFSCCSPFLWYFLWSIAGFEVKSECELDGFALVSFVIPECKLHFNVFLEQIRICWGSQDEIPGKTLPIRSFYVCKIKSLTLCSFKYNSTFFLKQTQLN